MGIELLTATQSFAYCILLNVLYILFVLLGRDCKDGGLVSVFLGLLSLFYFLEIDIVKIKNQN